MLPIKDSKSLLKFPFWVIVIVLLNAYVFYLELIAPNPDNLIAQYALTPQKVDFFRINTLIPLVSSQFLHAGFLHIISNMLFLWVFGNNIEYAFGFIFFPIFYVLAGIVAALTQYVITPSVSIPMLGASGAVAGILGAYFALYPNNKIKTLVFILIFITIIDIPAYILLFYWFITQLFNGVASISANPDVGGVAFLPHVGGFLFGWLAATFLLSKRSYPEFKFS
ncbi:rhomboid family intramembrane serine protease [Patescibacteria group bacterium]|nr:rhomboid family intramembrane serine protease [Patescibacteria group bacterium]